MNKSDVKVISFEGCVGVGKTSLTKYFSNELGLKKIIEEYEKNPFLEEYHNSMNVTLETEITFLLIHYSQIKKTINQTDSNIILCDFSIEKNLVFAQMTLNKKQLSVFEKVYDHIISEIGYPNYSIFIDLSVDIIRERIAKRGRTFEINADPKFFIEYNKRVRNHYLNQSKSKVYVINANDLILHPQNEKLAKIRDIIINIKEGKEKINLTTIP